MWQGAGGRGEGGRAFQCRTRFAQLETERELIVAPETLDIR